MNTNNQSDQTIEDILEAWFQRFAKDEPDGTKTLVLHETYGWEADEEAKYKLSKKLEQLFELEVEKRVKEATLLYGKQHQHNLTAFQCEEGCECDYIHLACEDPECTFYDMASGWNDCNVDWKYWIEEDPEHLKKLAQLNPPN